VTMDVRDMRVSEGPAVYELLVAEGWSRRIGSFADFTALLAASQRAVVAVAQDGRIVGFARAITDGLSNGYLSMVVVDPAFRRRGVGRALVERITAGPPTITWVLRAGREGAAEFFAACGFTASSIAMERLRE